MNDDGATAPQDDAAAASAPAVAVLFADPDNASRAYAEERLSALGFHIVTVADGAAAMQRLQSERFDLLLTTLDTPVIDGRALVTAIRADPARATLPVVVIVHRDETIAMDAAYAAGATTFVARPLHWPALAHQIRFVLRAEAQAEALRVARNAAQRADSFKTNMLRLLQHELRTPLALMVGFSEQIAAAPSHRRAAQYADEVIAAGRKLNTQFSALFSAAQVLAEEMRWDFDDLKVQDLLDEVQLTEEACAVERQVIVRYLQDCPGAVLRADARFLPLAIGHLVRNAIIHGGDSGRVDVVATARKSDAGEHVMLVVRDQGPGLSDEAVAQCFEPFGQSQCALTRSEHGFGLGLPFARRVVEAHGGSLRLASPPEGGLAATILLPATLPATQAIGRLRIA